MSKQDFASSPESANIAYGNVGKERPVTHARAPDSAGQAMMPAVEPSPVAILVCHGMGQQVRYETIGQLGASILNAARNSGCAIQSNGVELSFQNGDFLARVELNWTKITGERRQVHIYEAYWAPITQGKVTYRDTLRFLFLAGILGLWRGFSLGKLRSFERWMFGKLQSLRISPLTWVAVLVTLAALSLEVAAIAFIALRIAHAVREVAASPVPADYGSWVAIKHWALQILTLFVPPIGEFNSGPSGWLRAAWHSALWIALILQALFVRYFLIEYAGDVAAYISPYKDSKFDAIRHEIQAIGLNVAKVIYGFSGTTAGPNYERVVVVGHSLGSVVAYDTLNAIINLDETLSDPPRSRGVLDRTTHLITFGSPLDKTAFLFRNQSNHIHDPIREQMAAASQPLIISYAEYRQRLQWINLWSPFDVISGSLDYYDAADMPQNDPLRVRNERDPGAWVPFYAHVQYWSGKRLANVLYDVVK